MQTGIRRRIAQTALVLVTVAAGTLMIGSPALAEGEDPNTSGCSPVTTVREFVASKTGIRLAGVDRQGELDAYAAGLLRLGLDRSRVEPLPELRIHVVVVTESRHIYSPP
ncbi:hypothetical protein ACQPZX_34435 [Actinoplanes sp. CA-142083]|uniref:hypothetical protein n=1 Tax=Actinoplanes sp. CA-142083 TaxID=3239903 RepID=UPI003D90AAF5